jgi:hypothetical protein
MYTLRVLEEEDAGCREVSEAGAELDGKWIDSFRAGFQKYLDADGAEVKDGFLFWFGWGEGG